VLSTSSEGVLKGKLSWCNICVLTLLLRFWCWLFLEYICWNTILYCSYIWKKCHNFVIWLATSLKSKVSNANNCFVTFIKIIQKRRHLLESFVSEMQCEDSFVSEDDKSGKTFIFRKRKGKLVDFLDILLQTKVRKKLRHTEMGKKNNWLIFNFSLLSN